MDFLGDLFDFGDRKHGRGRHGHNDDYDEHGDHDDHGYNDRHREHRPLSGGYDERGRAAGAVPCFKCSTNLLSHFNFCPNCGTPISRPKKCGSCGGEVAAQAKFCSLCGTQA
jgi:hypothetical protein